MTTGIVVLEKVPLDGSWVHVALTYTDEKDEPIQIFVQNDLQRAHIFDRPVSLEDFSQPVRDLFKLAILGLAT